MKTSLWIRLLARILLSSMMNEELPARDTSRRKG